MWRRASHENIRIDRRRSSELSIVAPATKGVTAIDFDKLSKDSIGMWTRKASTTSKPTDSFAAEYGESPTSWRRRKLLAKQAREDDDGL